jgi:hypothetical protein
MAESNSSQISDAAAEWLLAALGNGRLYSAVMAVPALQDSVFRGGFQVAPATLAKPTIRKRLRLTLLGRSDRVVGLLREPGDVPWADAVCLLRALDGDWLKRNWRGLLRASANPALAAAMVADERQAIHRRGLRLLRRTASWLPTQTARPEALPAELRCAMPPAPADLPAALPASGPATDAGRQHETENLRDALSRQRDKARQNEQELRQARLEWEQREKDLRREIREARAGAEQAAAEVNARVAASAATFRQEVLGITPATARLAEASADAATGSLLERAERVLSEQRRQNELHGTYATLRARIRELTAMAQRLGTCVDESVKVLPEVRSLHAAICREVDRLQGLLPGGGPPTGELAAQLVARVKEPRPGADALAELERLEGILAIDVIADLLGEDGLGQVRQTLERRRRLVTDSLHAELDPAVPPVLRRAREVWDVRSALNGHAPSSARVFVDGYNAIRRVPELAAIEESGGLARSREALCELCRRRAQGLGHLEIVFDGQGPLSAREERDGLTVVFSNGLRDSQNADEYLLARVARARTEGGAVWLVTDDRGLRAQAESSCDAFIGCADWYRFLH